MASNRLLAIGLLVVGLILVFFAYQSSVGVGDQVTQAITGRFTGSSTGFLSLGVASAVAVVGLLLFGKATRH